MSPVIYGIDGFHVVDLMSTQYPYNTHYFFTSRLSVLHGDSRLVSL
jgi:hypothetical protein